MGAFNVNKIKDFGEAAKREMLKDQHAFKTARRLSHDAMGKKVPWVYPKLIDLPSPLVQPGSGSREKFTQAEREKGILQEIFLFKESKASSGIPLTVKCKETPRGVCKGVAPARCPDQALSTEGEAGSPPSGIMVEAMEE
ncbi:hypothetical protein KIL84_004783, partial [Mauremys mutica]